MATVTGKTIWIVGASSGIGFALAKALLDNENFVIMTARSGDKMRELSERYPNTTAILEADITQPNDLSNLSSRLAEKTDSLDFVVLSAGICEYDDGPHLESDMYRRVFDVNFFANVDCIRMALPLLKRARGSVVGVTSLAGVVPFPRAEAYGASKAAFDYFLQSLKVDLKQSGVNVMLVRPGFVDTPLTRKNDFSMPYLISAEEAAEAMMKGMRTRKTVLSFPWQLSMPLHFFSMFKSFWIYAVAGNFKKQYKL